MFRWEERIFAVKPYGLLGWLHVGLAKADWKIRFRGRLQLLVSAARLSYMYQLSDWCLNDLWYSVSSHAPRFLRTILLTSLLYRLQSALRLLMRRIFHAQFVSSMPPFSMLLAILPYWTGFPKLIESISGLFTFYDSVRPGCIRTHTTP